MSRPGMFSPYPSSDFSGTDSTSACSRSPLPLRHGLSDPDFIRRFLTHMGEDFYYGTTRKEEERPDPEKVLQVIKKSGNMLISLLQQSLSDEGGFNLLHWACFRNATELALQLIQLGVPVNQPDNGEIGSACVPLHYACRQGNEALVNRLIQVMLQQGGNINTPDLLGHTPLHYAAARNQLSIVKILLGFKARWLKNRDGETPLAQAFTEQSFDVVAYFVADYPHYWHEFKKEDPTMYEIDTNWLRYQIEQQAGSAENTSQVAPTCSR